jgi:hypothetical protein
MELSDISREIYESAKRLEGAGDALFLLAKKKAETERVYRRALQIEIVKLRAEKVQATLIPDIARGLTADLKFERDLAEARYASGRDNVDAISQQMNGLQSILKVQKDI